MFTENIKSSHGHYGHFGWGSLAQIKFCKNTQKYKHIRLTMPDQAQGQKTMLLSISDTSVRTIPFESLTKNDAMGGAHLFRPTTDFVYGLKRRFWRKLYKIPKLDPSWTLSWTLPLEGNPTFLSSYGGFGDLGPLRSFPGHKFSRICYRNCWTFVEILPEVAMYL